MLLFEGVRRGEALVNMTRVVRHSALDAASLSSAEVEGRRQVDEILRFLVERIDGFSGAYIAESGDYIGVRESRHLQGAYTVTEADVVGSAAFDDSVAMCAFPIDIHDPAGKGLVCAQTGGGAGYDIPYRAMVPAKVQNLLVTGRCVSATHEAAASLRITPTAMALGEAAGIAAAQCARESRTVPAVDVASVQESIRRHGGICGRMDVEWI